MKIIILGLNLMVWFGLFGPIILRDYMLINQYRNTNAKTFWLKTGKMRKQWLDSSSSVRSKELQNVLQKWWFHLWIIPYEYNNKRFKIIHSSMFLNMKSIRLNDEIRIPLHLLTKTLKFLSREIDLEKTIEKLWINMKFGLKTRMLSCRSFLIDFAGD